MSERSFIGDLFVFTYGIATRFVIVLVVLFSARTGAALLKHQCTVMRSAKTLHRQWNTSLPSYRKRRNSRDQSSDRRMHPDTTPAVQDICRHLPGRLDRQGIGSHKTANVEIRPSLGTSATAYLVTAVSAVASATLRRCFVVGWLAS